MDKKYNGEWQKLSKKLIKEIGMCEECESKKRLVVHHIKPLSDDGNLLERKNLKVLCQSCHKQYHKKIIKKEGDYSYKTFELNPIGNSYACCIKENGNSMCINLTKDFIKYFQIEGCVPGDFIFLKLKKKEEINR